MKVLLFSGGNDSTILLYYALKNLELNAVAHLDTGIGIAETQEFVRQVCDAWNVPLLIYRAADNTKADGTPDPMIYKEIVMQHGFPGPSAHTIMFSKLKERSLRRLKRDHAPNKPITYITGVRRDETTRRKISVRGEFQKQGRITWHSPLWDWPNERCDNYRRTWNIPVNPVSEKLGMSGECLCGAFAKPGELAHIGKHYPSVATRIQSLEKAFANQCDVLGMPSWNWEGSQPKWWTEHKRGQETLFREQMLCHSCLRKSA